MIKNIIFDLGNVLVSFHPEKFIEKNIEEKYKNDFYKVVFGGKPWQDLDRGVLEYSDAIEMFSKELPQCADAIKKLFDRKIIDCIAPIPENVEIMKSLKRKYNLYILSNFHYPAFDYIFDNWEFFKTFDGKIVSGHCKLLKPEKEIYELLLKTYSLKPEECLFIDDVQANIQSAENCGIHGIQLTAPELLKEKLEKYFAQSNK